jgi:hypothetical protein
MLLLVLARPACHALMLLRVACRGSTRRPSLARAAIAAAVASKVQGADMAPRATLAVRTSGRLRLAMRLVARDGLAQRSSRDALLTAADASCAGCRCLLGRSTHTLACGARAADQACGQGKARRPSRGRAGRRSVEAMRPRAASATSPSSAAAASPGTGVQRTCGSGDRQPRPTRGLRRRSWHLSRAGRGSDDARASQLRLADAAAAAPTLSTLSPLCLHRGSMEPVGSQRCRRTRCAPRAREQGSVHQRGTSTLTERAKIQAQRG